MSQSNILILQGNECGSEWRDPDYVVNLPSGIAIFPDGTTAQALMSQDMVDLF